MSLGSDISHEGSTLLVRVPLKRRQRGGHRLMIASEKAVLPGPVPDEGNDDPILKALGRAWRWKRLLESGDYASIADLAAEEKVHKSYLCRLLRLTLLSPTITESILDGTLSRDVLLADLMDSQVAYWAEQARRLPAFQGS